MSISDIKNTCLLLLSKSIDKYLPTRTLSYKSNESITQEDSIDNYPGLVRQRKSDIDIPTNVLSVKFNKVDKKNSDKAKNINIAAQRNVPGGNTGPVVSPSNGGLPTTGTPSTTPSNQLSSSTTNTNVLNNPGGGSGGGPGGGGSNGPGPS